MAERNPIRVPLKGGWGGRYFRVWAPSERMVWGNGGGECSGRSLQSGVSSEGLMRKSV